jgi:hypothetical protein
MRTSWIARSIALHRRCLGFRFSRAVIGLFLAFASPGSAFAEVVLPSLAPGSVYQLLFTTKSTRDAAYGDLSPYNVFVRLQAELNPALPATTWWAVVSTGQPAQSNAKVYADVPIYNTAGALIAASGSAFYSSTHAASMAYDQFGDLRLTGVWTGINANGSPKDYMSGYQPVTTYGHSGLLNEGWASSGFSFNNVETRAIYALSDRLVAVPEPSTSAMALACLVCGGFSMWRRRRQAGHA